MSLKLINLVRFSVKLYERHNESKCLRHMLCLWSSDSETAESRVFMCALILSGVTSHSRHTDERSPCSR